MMVFGAEDRLDRLEKQAENGYANPAQMLKLISKVRRRREAYEDLSGLNLPISSIEDGWLIDSGRTLYLFVRHPDGVTRTICLPRKKMGHV